jgi:hypothetical protein
MTPKEINDLKKLHNKYQEEGKELYTKVLELHEKCVGLHKQLMEAEGDDYDPIPLIFGAGFWIDPDL